MAQFSGYSLLELLFVLALVAALATFAYSGYREHLCHGYRMRAAADLRSCALQLERHFAARLTYEGATLAGCPGAARSAHRLALASASGDDFELRALPLEPAGCDWPVLQLTAAGTLSELAHESSERGHP